MSSKVNAIPVGYEGATPYLIVKDAARALEFYQKAFGATEVMRIPAPEGKVGHAEIMIGDSHVMLSDEWPDMNLLGPKRRGGATASLMLYVDDVDATFRRAVQGTSYSYAATASGAPGASLTFTLVDGAPGMQIGATSGVLSWAVPGDFAGKSARVALRVNDQYGGFHLQFFTLLGDKPNEPPVFTTQPLTSITTGVGSYVYTARSSDINLFETQTWSAPLKPAGATLTTMAANPAPGTWGQLTWPGANQTPVAPAGLEMQNPWCSIVPSSVRAFQPAMAWRQRPRSAPTAYATSPSTPGGGPARTSRSKMR